MHRGGVPLVGELGRECGEQTFGVAGREALQHGDAIGEVAVDGADGGTSAVGHHRGGEALVPDLVDHGCSGVEEGGEARGAARLDGLVADGGCRCVERSAQIDDGHGVGTFRRPMRRE